MKKDLLKGLTNEQIAKVSACKSGEEILALAKEEGIELTDEQLKAVSGGGSCVGPSFRDANCPHCGATVSGEFFETTPGDGKYIFRCTSCCYEWTEK